LGTSLTKAVGLGSFSKTDVVEPPVPALSDWALTKPMKENKTITIV
jgi:hypothetical protein